MAEEINFIINHLRNHNPVGENGVLQALDIFEHTPTQQEQIHPGMHFLTPVRMKKRRAVQGQWKRLHRPNAVNDADGNKIAICTRYRFIWNRLIEVRPIFEMQEYMLGEKMQEYMLGEKRRTAIAVIFEECNLL